MRASGDPKYAHLEEDLHVLIEVEAPPGQAHARLGLAIEEIKKFLVPVSIKFKLSHQRRLSLGTGAMNACWGPCENTRLRREVPWQHYEQEQALQAVSNHLCHTEGISVEKFV